MKARDIQTLFDYNYWANHRILEAAEQVDPEQYMAPIRISHGSLHGTLVHILGTEWVWRQRCQEGVSPKALLTLKDLPTLASLQESWAAEEERMRAYLAGLTDDDLVRPVKYTTTIGVPLENTLWHILAHVVNHGTQFRGEAGVLLSRRGHSPGDIDFIVYMRAGVIV